MELRETFSTSRNPGAFGDPDSPHLKAKKKTLRPPVAGGRRPAAPDAEEEEEEPTPRWEG